MPQDAPPNGGAPTGRGPWSVWSVSGLQAKLHRWAAADAGRRFGDLFVRHEAEVWPSWGERPWPGLSQQPGRS